MFPLRSAALSSIERSNHPLKCDDTITAFDQLFHRLPIDRPIGAKTHPLAASVRRDEEFLAPLQPIDIGRIQAKRDRRVSLDTFERHERAFAGLEIRMSPRRRLARLGQRETQRAKPLQCPFVLTWSDHRFSASTRQVCASAVRAQRADPRSPVRSARHQSPARLR